MVPEQTMSNTPSNDQTSAPMEDPAKEAALNCARLALDKKAENLSILDVSKRSGFCDFFVICSAISDRQVHAIADSITTGMKQLNYPPRSVEGYSEGRWVVIDLGDVMVHIFLDAIRDYYDLEGAWSSSPRVSVPKEYYGLH